MGEFKKDEDKDEAINKAQDAYREAVTQSEILPPTNEIRLGLHLNYSVFFYEILQNPNIAVEKAQHAFDEAMTEFDNLDEASA